MVQPETFFRRLEARKPEAAMALGLDRIRGVLDDLGAPDRDLPCILVAGTNGKGSTSRFIAELARQSGRSTGLFCSPHVFSPTERVVIDGSQVGAAELTEAMAPLADGYSQLTYFELFAVAAIQLFARHRVDVAVLEIGLGGRLDATNAVENVIASVITSIGLDHTHILGDTIEQIAAEKGGVIRPGVPVFAGGVPDAAAAVLGQIAVDQGAPVVRSGGVALVDGWAGPDVLLQNLGLAVTVSGHLFGDLQVDLQALLALRPYGRWTVLPGDPVRVIDGAHNPQAIAAVLPAVGRLAEQHGPVQVWLQLGATKDGAGVVALLSDTAHSIVLVDGDEHWFPAAELQRILAADGRRARVVPSTQAPASFLASAQPAVWLGTLRGLDAFSGLVTA